MGYPNGQIPLSALTPIPGGHLRDDAARAWNDMRDFIGQRHGVWIAPRGSQSSYRTYAQQVYWRNYWCNLGKCGNAAYPGTSNHGWGLAVDVLSPVMVSYIKLYGSRFGWYWGEAPSEWWHVTYRGGYTPAPKPDPLKGLTKKERGMATKLIYHRRRYEQEAKGGKGPRYYAHFAWARYWKRRVDAQRNRLARLARTDGGWKKYHRGLRYNILSKVYNRKIR